MRQRSGDESSGPKSVDGKLRSSSSRTKTSNDIVSMPGCVNLLPFVDSEVVVGGFLIDKLTCAPRRGAFALSVSVRPSARRNLGSSSDAHAYAARWVSTEGARWSEG